MRKSLVLAIALGAASYLLASDAYAHGGAFRGPNGGVPPGMREPSDPEPPPPPPSDPGDPNGPTTPGEPGGGPTTPSPEPGTETPGDTGPPAPIAPSQPGGRAKPTTKALTFESWRFWWGYNNDDILSLKMHIYSERAASSSPIFFSSKKDEENRRNAQRPTQRAVMTTIIPALMRTINRAGDHEDIHGGALVALGKIGTANYIQLFKDCLNNEFKNEKGVRMDFGYQATESACLALGLLPDLDDASKEAVRNVLLEAIDNEKLRTRERTWAAVCLGFQRDKGAARALWSRLGKNYPDKNVPAGILAGIGLIGHCEETKALVAGLVELFEKGTVDGKEVGGEEQLKAFAGYALTKIEDPSALEAVNRVLNSRRQGRITKRSAAIAAGVLGAKTPDENLRDETVQTLKKYVRKSGGDASGENFALVALSQIGSVDALNFLMDTADSGKYGQRPFAGLGLATYVWYQDRAADRGEGPGMDKARRGKIVDRLKKLSDKYKDADTKAAFMLGRGLVKDESAIEELTTLVAKQGDPTLRGFCCVALGLIGKAREDVKYAMKKALEDRSNDDLRRDAATGLALLRDAEVVTLLLDELKKAKSFAVQGQLITAIGTIGDHTAIDPLVQILDDRSQPSQTRAMAAVGLGMIGDLRELPELARLSKNYNYRATLPDLDELLFIL